MADDPTFDVFLCHNSDDKDDVKRIGKRLKKAGLKPWLDEWALRPGSSWQDVLEEQIGSIRTVAVFVGESGLGPWHKRELQAFIREFVDRECHVIPVILSGEGEPELPRFLRGLTWVDFRKKDPDPFQHLIWGITGKNDEDEAQSENPSLKAQLEVAEQQRTTLRISGGETRKLDEKIVQLKREIREGIHLKPGQYLGRYRLCERIGSGGFAEVWKAWDPNGERLVAVKVLHPQHAQNKTKRERFFRGARQMAKLDHSGIVEVYEPRLEEKERFFFVMACLEGDLHHAVKSGSVETKAIFPLILKLGEALQYAHERGIVHRDVKPGNVLLDAEGRPYLADFDLVRAHDTTGGTRTGALGTFLFAAPEAMKNAKVVEASADVYGLAMCALFCLLKGDLDIDIIPNPNHYLRDLECGEAAKKVLLKGIAWNAEERWETVEAFSRALVRALEEKPGKKTTVDRLEQTSQEELTDGAQPDLPALEDPARWIRINPGTFTMGSNELNYDPSKPAHQVTLTYPYYLGRYPVTNEEYRAFINDGGYGNQKWWTNEGWSWRTEGNIKEPRRYDGFEGDRQPVVGVSWYEAVAYCRWLTAVLEGRQDGLAGNQSLTAHPPTEAQWEFAARGVEGKPYPWGKTKPDKTLANFGKNIGKTTEVGRFPKGNTPEGLEDMAGNVWEWCLDIWDDKVYVKRKGEVTDPVSKDGNRALRSLRGGSWDLGSWSLPAAIRFGTRAGDRDGDIGFRVCLSPVPAEHVLAFDL